MSKKSQLPSIGQESLSVLGNMVKKATSEQFAEILKKNNHKNTPFRLPPVTKGGKKSKKRKTASKKRKTASKKRKTASKKRKTRKLFFFFG